MLARLFQTALVTYSSLVYGCQSQPKAVPEVSRQTTTNIQQDVQPAVKLEDRIAISQPVAATQLTTTSMPTTQPAKLEELAGTSYKITDLSQDYAIERTSNLEFPFKTQAMVLWGNTYVSTANTERAEDERANLLIPINKSSIRHKKGHLSTIAPEEIYTLQRLRNDAGQPATKIWLNHEGPCGKKAVRKNYQTTSAEARVIEITEKDFEFNIGKICIDGKWNYAPKYNDTFILGSDETTTIEIAPDGRIALINEKDGFYYPQQNSAQDFRARTKTRLAKETADKAAEDARIEANNKIEKEKRAKSPGEVAKIE